MQANWKSWLTWKRTGSASNTETALGRASAMEHRQWVLGLLATALIFTLVFHNRLDVLERIAIDYRARWFGSFNTPPSPELAVIAIDDAANENIGRWPWPRQKIAAIIDELSRAGASTIALDLLLDDPQEVQYIPVSPTTAQPKSTPTFQAVQGDQVLADSIKRAGNVVTAMQLSWRSKTREAAASSSPSTSIQMAQRATYSQVAAALASVPFAERADRSRLLNTVRTAVLTPEQLAFTKGPEVDHIAQMIDAVLSVRAKRDSSALDIPPLARQWTSSQNPNIALAPFTLNSARLGNVTFDTYDPDGQTRRIPLLIEHAGKLWPTLGLAAVLEHWKVPLSSITFDQSDLIIPMPDGNLRKIHHFADSIETQTIYGLTYVSWPRPTAFIPTTPDGKPEMTGWQYQFYNLQTASNPAPAAIPQAEFPIGRVYEPTRIHLRIIDNLDQLLAASSFLQSVSVLSNQEHDRFSSIITTLRSDNTTSADASSRALAELATLITSALSSAEGVLATLDPAATDKPTQTLIANITTASEALPKLNAAIADGFDAIAKIRAELKLNLQGKVCFVGWTGTGFIADFVNTSVAPRTPGVHVHVALANSVLTGFQRTPGPQWANLLVLSTLGVFGTFLAIRAGVLLAPILLTLTSLAWLAFNSIFLWDYLRTIWDAITPVVACIAAGVVVLLHRFFIENRARKKTEERFKSYVSPRVVDILVSNPQLNSMEPQRKELTVMFTDLAAFSTFAERLGSVGTAKVLATYLGNMTDIVQKHGATLDKYIGDAIVAFWGAPIDDPKHAQNACNAALEMVTKMDELNQQNAFGPDLKLFMRVGLGTGELMVGDFGNPPRNSSYTVLGDTANLASRLEGANKFFGTQILAAHPVKLAAGSHLRWRTIGKVRVKGKLDGILIHQLIGDRDIKGPITSNWLQTTENLVSIFTDPAPLTEARIAHISAAIEALRKLGDDDLADIYQNALEPYLAIADLRPSFDGCITLTDK